MFVNAVFGLYTDVDFHKCNRRNKPPRHRRVCVDQFRGVQGNTSIISTSTFFYYPQDSTRLFNDNIHNGFTPCVQSSAMFFVYSADRRIGRISPIPSQSANSRKEEGCKSNNDQSKAAAEHCWFWEERCATVPTRALSRY